MADSSNGTGWLEVSGVSGLLAAVPASAGAVIFGLAVEKPLVDHLTPDLVQFQQTLASRLELTSPLTIGVAIITMLWITQTPREVPVRMIFSGLALAFTTWLGKTLAFGLAADVDASVGHYITQGGQLAWVPAAMGETTRILSGNMFTRGIGLLINYFQLYGPAQFLMSVACGALLGWYWTHRATRLMRGY